ncbi:hypothetical protein RCXUPER_223 [Rhodobacter phage RcXuper]|nr:hypothetical protein RCXUPER_223 [Rhodobacter phage RcXuper]
MAQKTYRNGNRERIAAMTRQVKNTAARAQSDLVAFIRADIVRAELDKLQNQFLTVTFMKNNGELRTYNGQLRATSRLVGNDRGIAQGQAMKERGQVWLALPNGESKSFYLDRVVNIRARGLDMSAGAQ